MPQRWIDDEREIAGFLSRAKVGRLGTCWGGQPYVTPVAFVFRDGKLYFHSKPTGRKIGNLKANPRVCFEADELERIHLGDSACSHSMRYTSVIAFGQARIVTDQAVKQRALGWLITKYTGSEWAQQLSEKELATVEVVEITVEELTGKKNVDA